MAYLFYTHYINITIHFNFLIFFLFQNGQKSGIIGTDIKYRRAPNHKQPKQVHILLFRDHSLVPKRQKW